MSKIYEALKSAQKERSAEQRGPLGLVGTAGGRQAPTPVETTPVQAAAQPVESSQMPPEAIRPTTQPVSPAEAPTPETSPVEAVSAAKAASPVDTSSTPAVNGQAYPAAPAEGSNTAQPVEARASEAPPPEASQPAETGQAAERRPENQEAAPANPPSLSNNILRERQTSSPPAAPASAEVSERPRMRRVAPLRRPLAGPIATPPSFGEASAREGLSHSQAQAQPQARSQEQTQAEVLPPSDQAAPRWRRRMAKEVASLYRPIRDHLPSSGGLVAFVGVDSKTGTSLVAREFAQFLASDAGHNTLLLDGDAKRREQFNEFRTLCRADLSDVVYDGIPLQHAVHSLGNSGLSLAALSGRGGARTLVVGSPRLQGVLSDLRRRFDYTIVDCPQAEDDPQALNLCGEADLTIIVLNGGKTEANRAARLKTQIEAMGGRPFGVVLNTRGFRLPGWLRGMA